MRAEEKQEVLNCFLPVMGANRQKRPFQANNSLSACFYTSLPLLENALRELSVS